MPHTQDLRVVEVARLLGVTEATVYDKLRRGMLPFHTEHGCYRITRQAVRQYRRWHRPGRVS